MQDSKTTPSSKKEPNSTDTASTGRPLTLEDRHLKEQVRLAEEGVKQGKNGIGLVRWWNQIRERQARGLLTDVWLKTFTTGYLVLNAKKPGDGVTAEQVAATLIMLGVPLVKPKRVISSL